MAEEGERPLLDQLFEQTGLDLRNEKILFTGVGGINIIRNLQHIDRDTEIYNVGYAGSANFDLGTWVEVTESRLNHPNVTYPEPELKLSPITNHQSKKPFVTPTATSSLPPITKIASSIWNWRSSQRSVSGRYIASNMSAITSRCMRITS